MYTCIFLLCVKVVPTFHPENLHFKAYLEDPGLAHMLHDVWIIETYVLECPRKLGSMVRINGLFHPNIPRFYVGYSL